ncbi:hypothetical protein CEXT_666171 [Caerostris extrusa]|uniref:Uncharacterized protein n=1 Tax=Caerostris extrusa TaxID=172846 RepID=A0AAV4TSI6_CAEEX|nr:hypothetical protein CEXT_666171 [Caerostris extrusa]
MSYLCRMSYLPNELLCRVRPKFLRVMGHPLHARQACPDPITLGDATVVLIHTYLKGGLKPLMAVTA